MTGRTTLVAWGLGGLFLASLLTLLVLYQGAERSLTQGALERRQAVAELAATTLAEKLAHTLDLARALAMRKGFAEFVEQGRWLEANEIMPAEPKSYTGLLHIYLADAGGIVRATQPAIEPDRESGPNLAHIPWFAEFLRRGRPYIGPLTSSALVPQHTVVPSAVPVRAASGELIGSLVLELNPREFFDWAWTIKLGRFESLHIADTLGQAGFQVSPAERRQVALPGPVLARLKDGASGFERFAGASSQEAQIAIFSPGAHSWGVVLHQPESEFFAERDRQLRLAQGAFGLGTLLLIGLVALARRSGADRARLQADRALIGELEGRVERRTAALALSEARFRRFAEAAGDWFWETDAENRFTWISDNFEDATGIRTEQLYGKSREEYVLAGRDRAAEPWKSHFEVIRRREPFRDFRYPRQGPGGEQWLSVDAIPTFDAQRRFLGWRGVASDITRQIEAERKTSELFAHQANYLRELIDAIPISVSVRDREGRHVLCNRAFAARWGLAPEQVFGKTLAELTPASPMLESAQVKDLDALAAGGLIEPYEVTFPDGAGVMRTWQVSKAALTDMQGKASQVVSVGTEVTERRQMLRTLESSLEEKELLLREIHHRVKNNLQVISALLALRSRRLSEPADRAVFEECGERVRAMALLHETLYREGRFGRVELRAYLKQLADFTLASHARPGVRTEVRGAELSVDLDIAVPLAQIAAELLLNSLKHGFPNGAGGKIELELAAEPGGGRMRIADDGVGLAPDFQLEGRDTLGMRVVSMLAEQIAGEFSVERLARGAAFAVRWKAGPA